MIRQIKKLTGKCSIIVSPIVRVMALIFFYFLIAHVPNQCVASIKLLLDNNVSTIKECYCEPC